MTALHMREQVAARLAELSGRRGVYLLAARSGRVLYVGKSNRLGRRIRESARWCVKRNCGPVWCGVMVVARARGVPRVLCSYEGRLIRERAPRFNRALPGAELVGPLPAISPVGWLYASAEDLRGASGS